MSTPKKLRFGSGSAVTQAIGDLVRRGQGAAGDFHYDRVDLDRIEPDPDNPRQLRLEASEFAQLCDPEWVRGARGTEVPDGRTRALLRLRELADSMMENDVLEPIRVFRYGARYRIAYGERRYWAARLAGLKDIPARISEQCPDRVRTLQLVENLHRDDLDLAARVRNVMAVLEELREEGEPSAERLGALVGMGERNARRYFRIATGPQDLMDAVLGGQVRDLATAASLAAMDDARKRQGILGALAQGMTLSQAEEAITRALNPPVRPPRGRPTTRVVLGATANTRLVRVIMERVLGKGALPQLDWDDLRAVSKVWKAFLKELERGL